MVGRAAECGFALPADSKLSRMHFTVVSRDSGFALKDLNSVNQTVVAEEAVVLTELEDEDEIQAGQTLFRVEVGAAISQPDIDELPVDQTAMFKRPDALPSASKPANKNRPATKVRTDAVILLVLDGPHKGEQHIIERGRGSAIGRGDEANFQLLSDKALSRVHFAIDFKGETVEFKDLGSANGTLVNKQSETATTLKNGDMISAGDSRFHIQFQNMPMWSQSDEGDSEGDNIGFRNLSDTVQFRRPPKV